MLLLLTLSAAIAIPLGLDLFMPVPEDNPLTVESGIAASLGGSTAGRGSPERFVDTITQSNGRPTRKWSRRA